MCLIWPSSKKDSDELRKQLSESEKKYREKLEKLGVKVVALVELGFNPEENKARIKIDLFPKTDKGVPEKNFLKPFPMVQKIMDVLTRYKIKKFDGTSCTKFAFNPKVFKLVGELVLPAKIVLRSDLTKKLGESELAGLMIGFKESPIGISKVAIELENEDLTVRVITDYELVSFEDMVMKSYNHSKQVANLFVEEKK